MNKILVALSTFVQYGSEPLEILKKSGIPYVINPLGKRLSREEIIQLGSDCTGVIAGVEPYDDYVIDRMTDLRCISRCGVGIDNISLEKAAARGIKILNTPDVVVRPVAELTVAMIFDLLRKLTLHTALLKAGRWEKIPGQLLAGKKVGILGLGRIGKKVAELLRGLDASVYGTDLSPDVYWARNLGIQIVSLEELLGLSDILSVHLSVMKDKRIHLGEKEIKMMKKGALLVNTARGEIVDDVALYNALRERYLGGAALDVYPQEPYNGKMGELDNVVLTPHVATLTIESRVQMELEAVMNLIHFFKT